MDFQPFDKIARLSRPCTITEKIDGTNASVYIAPGEFLCGSRTRWITPEDDNYGFARWAHEHREELVAGLGEGHHFGEWWGQGVQRKYDQGRKRWSLFNTHKWRDDAVRPACCDVVPVLAEGVFSSVMAEGVIMTLRERGSAAAPGFMKPEGIIIYHHALGKYFKKTLDKDDEWKGKQA